MNKTKIHAIAFTGRLPFFSNQQELYIEVNIAAKQEQSKNCGGNHENGVSVNQKDDNKPYYRYYPNRLNQCLYPKWMMDGRILITLFGEKQDQQTKNGKYRSQFINNISLYHREVALLSIKTDNCKHFGNQEFRFVTGKIGVKQHPSKNEEEKSRNFPSR